MKKRENKLCEVLNYLEALIKDRSRSKNSSYTSSMLAKKIDRISQKVGEEAIEVVIASNQKSKKKVIYESSDLIYHLLILWKKLDIKNVEIAKELLKRKNEK